MQILDTVSKPIANLKKYIVRVGYRDEPILRTILGDSPTGLDPKDRLRILGGRFGKFSFFAQLTEEEIIIIKLSMDIEITYTPIK